MSIVKDLIREFILTKNTYKHGSLTYLVRKGFAYLTYIPRTTYYQAARRDKRFKYQGKEYPYYYDLYNATWRNERAIEIPIVMDSVAFRVINNIGSLFESVSVIAKEGILEIGNVLPHYYNVRHDVLDLYERGQNIINEDATTFIPEKKYDLVVSISTLEHIGIDETPYNPGKIIWCLRNIQKNMLKPGGKLIATVPVGYNGCLDQLLTLETDLFSSVHCMWRKSHSSLDWIEVDWTPNLIKCAKVKDGYGATLIAILEMTNDDN